MKHLESFSQEYKWIKESLTIIDRCIMLEDISSEMNINYRVGYLNPDGLSQPYYALYYNKSKNKLEGDDAHVNAAFEGKYGKLCIRIECNITTTKTPFKDSRNCSYNSDDSDIVIKILNETISIYKNIKGYYNRFITFDENYISIDFVKNNIK